MKKISLFIAGAIFMTNVAFADVFTLEQAIKAARENSSNVISLEAERRSIENELEKAEKNTRRWKNKTGYSFEDIDEYKLYHGYTLKEVKLKYESYLKNIEKSGDEAELNVQKYISNIYVLTKNIELLEKQIEIASKDVEIAKIKLKMKLITESELDNQELTLNSLKDSLENSKEQLEFSKDCLQNLTGVKLNEKIQIVFPECETKQLNIDDINEYIDERINENYYIINSKYQYELLSNQYEIAQKTSNIFLEGTLSRKVLEDQYSASYPQLENSVNSMKEYAKNLYTQIKSEESSIEEAKSKIIISEANYEQLKKKYDLGIISKLNLEKEELNLQGLKVDLEIKILKNNISKVQFEMFMKSGAGV